MKQLFFLISFIIFKPHEILIRHHSHTFGEEILCHSGEPEFSPFTSPRSSIGVGAAVAPRSSCFDHASVTTLTAAGDCASIASKGTESVRRPDGGRGDMALMGAAALGRRVWTAGDIAAVSGVCIVIIVIIKPIMFASVILV